MRRFVVTVEREDGAVGTFEIAVTEKLIHHAVKAEAFVRLRRLYGSGLSHGGITHSKITKFVETTETESDT